MTLICLAGAGLVTGCASMPAIDPVSWWHNLEGGTIAEQRPPPPGQDAPYPNLATVPPKPTPPDPEMRARISSGLIADRANAQYADSLAPIPDPSSRTASPGLFGGAVPPPPPADPDASTASLPAASAPPPAMPFKPAVPAAPATPPARAPRVGVAEAPLAPPIQQAAATPPTIPDAPPLAPVLPGVNIPVTAPAPPAAAPPKPPPGPRTATPDDIVPVAFAPGSAVLPPGSDVPLKRLIALGKGAKGIAIIGYGESNSSSPGAQDTAVRLALLRAQAIAAVFAASGVPSAQLRLDAQASGTGGEARLVN